MITANTQVIGVSPRISPATFEAILKAAGSPAASDSDAIYAAIVGEGADPAFALAFFKHESQFGQLGVCHDYETKSIGNTRTSRIGVKTFVWVPGKGPYVRYPDWQTGARDAIYRLTDPEFDYAKAGAKTIGQILPIWAPKSDFNSPEAYINSVVSSMREWIDSENTTMLGILNLNGFVIGHGFKTYFEANGGIKFFGLPLTNEYTNLKTSLTEQVFERYVLEYDPKASPDWQVRGKDVGRFYLSKQSSQPETDASK